MAFLGASHYIRHNFGEELLSRIVSDAGPATQKTFSKNRRPGLQPYERSSACCAASTAISAGDLRVLQALGDLAARQDLQTIFKGYAVRPSPEDMIRACTPIWGMYTEGAGHMLAVHARPDNTVLRIHDFPDMDPAHCRLMEGWMIAAMDFIGARVLPGACERQCMSRGDSFHEFWCRWEIRE
jgi:hypothetical protein